MSKAADLRMPEIGETVRLVGRLVEIQDVTPPPPPKELDYIFLETTATVQIRANGHIISNEVTMNDLYGSAVESAINEARKFVKKLGPGVEIVVVRHDKHYRARPSGRQDFYNQGLMGFDRLGDGAKRGLPDDVNTVVWSSFTDQGAGGQT